jgi:hypothetical protein
MVLFVLWESSCHWSASARPRPKGRFSGPSWINSSRRCQRAQGAPIPGSSQQEVPGQPHKGCGARPQALRSAGRSVACGVNLAFARSPSRVLCSRSERSARASSGRLSPSSSTSPRPAAVGLGGTRRASTATRWEAPRRSQLSWTSSNVVGSRHRLRYAQPGVWRSGHCSRLLRWRCFGCNRVRLGITDVWNLRALRRGHVRGFLRTTLWSRSPAPGQSGVRGDWSCCAGSLVGGASHGQLGGLGCDSCPRGRVVCQRGTSRSLPPLRPPTRMASVT